MQIWKIMFCELLIFTITISRYGYSTCMYTIFKFAKYCKILISCTNNDQIPYFCQVYIPDIIYKMHEGEIDSPHKDPLYHIFTSQVFFICLCSPSVCEENKQIENTLTWEDAVSIMQTFTYFIVHLATLKIGIFFFFLNWI